MMKELHDLPMTDARLRLAASFVRPGCIPCDVGTDHGYLPIWLILSGICPRAVVSDVNASPLDNARENAARFGCTARLSFYLADGLDSIDLEKEQVQDILICGMGGELIARILENSDYTRRTGVKCILQPMSSVVDLRQYLARRGYRIEDEKLAGAAGKIYTCLHVSYDGVARDPSPVELLLGEAHIRRGRAGNQWFSDYLLREIRSVRKRRNGLAAGGHDTAFEDDLLAEMHKIAESEGVAL